MLCKEHQCAKFYYLCWKEKEKRVGCFLKQKKKSAGGKQLIFFPLCIF